MPTFNIFDVFCLPGPKADGNIDFSNATVLDPVAYTTGAVSPAGDPQIAPGGTFNGSEIVEVGTAEAAMTECNGDNTLVRPNYIETQDGSIYYFFGDASGISGDFEIASMEIANHGETEFFNAQGHEINDNQTTCVCFARGMKLATSRGPIAVEDLKPGARIKTLDNGYQTLRAVYHKTVPAMGSNTPILFTKGSIGNTADLIVSPKHRMYTGTLPADVTAQFANYADHLIHAEALCNGTTIRPMPEQKTVQYFHLMFDKHELVWCQNTVSESWQPTKKALKNAPEMAEELLSIFPELATATQKTPGALARYEIRLSS